jgi:hypothetical protein
LPDGDVLTWIYYLFIHLFKHIIADTLYPIMYISNTWLRDFFYFLNSEALLSSYCDPPSSWKYSFFRLEQSVQNDYKIVWFGVNLIKIAPLRGRNWVGMCQAYGRC